MHTTRRFAGWLSPCPIRHDKGHDECDVFIVALITRHDASILPHLPFPQRVRSIRRGLRTSQQANPIYWLYAHFDGNLNDEHRIIAVVIEYETEQPY